MKILNPQSADIEGLAGEAPIASAHLNLDWIRNRFAQSTLWQPELTDEHRFAATGAEFKDASVLIALIQRAHGLTILFTRRTAHLSHHAGQISFPGGRAESHDRDAVDTALRESHEEIGLERSSVEILGQLPHYYTITGYRVTPVVGAIIAPGLFKSDQNEVAEIFEVPLEFLMNGNAHQRRSLAMTTAENQAIRRSFYAMPYQDYFIWGATAGMLRNLFHFLRA